MRWEIRHRISTLDVLLCIEETWNIFAFSLFVAEMMKLVEICIHERQQRCILCNVSQHHGCWRPGKARSQGSNIHCIDLFHPIYLGLNFKGLTTTMSWTKVIISSKFSWFHFKTFHLNTLCVKWFEANFHPLAAIKIKCISITLYLVSTPSHYM